MISNAAAPRTELRSSRTSIVVLHPAERLRPRAPLARRAPLSRKGFFADLRAVLRMAVGIDDDSEDYECAR
jgi:hypothetical protein